MVDQALDPASEANIEDPGSLIDKDFHIGGDFSLGAPVPPSTKTKPVAEDDPYDAIMRKQEQAGEIGIFDRARLNAVDGFTRGTLAGAAAMRGLKAASDSENLDPATRQKARAVYDSFNNDLVRYDLMRSFEGPLEGSAAFAGQVYGSLFSPESLVVRVPGLGKIIGTAGGGTIARIGEGFATQAGLQLATDPAVQALSIGAGTQQEFSPARTALGAAIGGAVGGGGAAIGAGLEKWIGKNVDPVAQIRQELQSEIDLIESGRRESAADAPALRTPEDEVRVSAQSPVPTGPVRISFTTAKGSTYEVQSGGTTIRTKAARADVGHEGDEGVKTQSELTVYLDPQDAGRLATPQGNWRFIDHGNSQISLATPAKGGGWGISPSARNVSYSDAPEVGKIPLELWTPKDTNGQPGFSKAHFGNEIVSTTAPTLRTMTPGEKSLTPAIQFSKAEGEKPIIAYHGTDNSFNEFDIQHNLEGLGGTFGYGHSLAAEEGYAKEFGRNVYKVAISPGPIIDMQLPFGEQTAEVQSALRRAFPNERLGRDTAIDNLVTTKEAANTLSQLGVKGLSYEEIKGKKNYTIFKSSDLTVQPRGTSPIAEGVVERPVSGGPVHGAAGKPAVTPPLQFAKGGGETPLPPARPTAVPTPEAAAAVRSLQQQGSDLADSLDFPLRQGRVEGGAAGQYSAQGVARVKNVAAFETVAHEAGHKIEDGIGADMTALIKQHAVELGPMDYDIDKARPSEGFAQFVSKYILDPIDAERLAPEFHAAFEQFIGQRVPELMTSLQDARASYERWQNATSLEHLAAMLAKPADETITGAIKADGLWPTVKNYIHEFYRTALDRHSPIARATRGQLRIIRNAIGTLPRLTAADNPEILARSFERAFQAAENDALLGVARYRGTGREGPALTDGIKLGIGSPGENGPLRAEKKSLLDQYLIVRRAQVLWRKFDAGLLPRRPIALSKEGVDTAIRELEAANPTFRDAAQMVHDYTRQLLRKAYDAGLIDKEGYETLLQEEFYVPLRRDVRDKPLAGGGGAPRTEGPGATAIIKRQTGSDRDIISPLESIISQTILINRTIAHNDIVRALVALADRATAAGATGAGRIVEKIPAHKIVGKDVDLIAAAKAAMKKNGVDEVDADFFLAGITDLFGEDPVHGTLFHKEPTSKGGEPILFYKDGGKLKAVRLIAGKEGLALYEALTDMPPHMRDFGLEAGRIMADVMRAGVVVTPAYLLKNLFRDTVAAAIMIRGFATFILNPFNKGVIGYNEAAQLYKQAGGFAGGARYRSVDELAGFRPGEVEKELTKRAFGAGVSAIEKFKLAMEAGERGVRVQVFRVVYGQKLKQGMSPYEAMREAAYAADDTLDFSRYGSQMLFLRRLIPFINSHIQGLDKARRTFIEPLTRAARGDIVSEAEQDAVKNAKLAWFKAGAIGGVAGYAYGLWGMNHDAYRNAGDRDSANNLVLPGEAVGSTGTFLVPKPFELAFIFNLGEAVARAAHSDKRAFEYAYKGAADLFLTSSIFPPGLKTVGELVSGSSTFTGRPIVPESEQAKIPAMQAKATTSALARAIGESTKDLPTNLQLSPVLIDHALGGFFGSAGRMVGKLSSALSPNAPGQSFEDVLFANQLVKDTPEVYDDIKRRFWDNTSRTTGQYARAKGQLADYFEKGRIEDATRYLQGLPDAQKVYAILETQKSEFKDSLRFKPDEKLLHPMKRAAEAVSALWPLVDNLTENKLTGMRGDQFPALDKTKRRMLLNQVQTLQHMEMRNALVMTAEPGYDNQRIMSTDDQFAVIKTISPEVAADVAARYSEKKIRPEAQVAEAWPQVQQRILQDGGDAILSDLAAAAAADGYAFGEAVRVKKPKPARPIIKSGAEGLRVQ